MSEKIGGVCKVWRGEYGFLLVDDGRAVFLHYRECERCGIRPPKAGDKLKFEIERGRKGSARYRCQLCLTERPGGL